MVILPDSSKVFVACPGSNQVAAVDLKSDRLLAYLDVGQLPAQLTLKPDGGELFVGNFNSNSFSIIETGNNEVGGSYLIGSNPSHGVVTSDNGLLYMSNFGSARCRSAAILTRWRLRPMRRTCWWWIRGPATSPWCAR
jgi:YVTN family beta-propeller protein